MVPTALHSCPHLVLSFKIQPCLWVFVFFSSLPFILTHLKLRCFLSSYQRNLPGRGISSDTSEIVFDCSNSKLEFIDLELVDSVHQLSPQRVFLVAPFKVNLKLNVDSSLQFKLSSKGSYCHAAQKQSYCKYTLPQLQLKAVIFSKCLGIINRVL